jgi:hypothetical protein
MSNVHTVLNLQKTVRGVSTLTAWHRKLRREPEETIQEDRTKKLRKEDVEIGKEERNGIINELNKLDRNEKGKKAGWVGEKKKHTERKRREKTKKRWKRERKKGRRKYRNGVGEEDG